MQVQPVIASTQRLNGTTYAVLMIDMDIPTSTPPQTSTLLHWMQTGLTPAPTTTTLNTTRGALSVFLLQNSSNTSPFASYIGPNPPANTVPLSHRYVQILVDTTNAPQTTLDSLRTAAQTRQGFNADSTLRAVGLSTRVVAGNFFNVSASSSSSTPTTNGSTTGTIPGTTFPNGSTSTNGTRPIGTSAAGQVSQCLPLVVLSALVVLFFRV